MIEQYLSIYKEINSSKKIVNSFPIMVKISLILIPLLGVCLTIMLLNTGCVWILFIVMLLMLIFLFILNKYRDKAIKKIFEKDNVSEYNRYKNERFLIETRIKKFNDEQIQFLIKYIEEYADDFKVSHFIKVGSLAAILIPVWVAFLDVLFNQYKACVVDSFILFMAILLIVFILFVASSSILNLLDRFIYRDYYKLKAILASLQEEYLIRMIKIKA